MPLNMGMKEKTRGGRFIFACFVFAVAFLTYGRIAFQEPEDNPGLIPFSTQYSNSDTLSPEERLRRRQLDCLEKNLYRNVRTRADGDAVELRDACMGPRVLALEETGATLNLQQRAVAKAAHDYERQKLYYYLSGVFAVMGAIPLTYIRCRNFWIRYGAGIKRFADSCRDIFYKGLE